VPTCTPLSSSQSCNSFSLLYDNDNGNDRYTAWVNENGAFAVDSFRQIDRILIDLIQSLTTINTNCSNTKDKPVEDDLVRTFIVKQIEWLSARVQQDYEELRGGEEAGVTSIQFRRLLNTGELDDTSLCVCLFVLSRTIFLKLGNEQDLVIRDAPMYDQNAIVCCCCCCCCCCTCFLNIRFVG
jgi:hypothetical protein